MIPLICAVITFTAVIVSCINLYRAERNLTLSDEWRRFGRGEGPRPTRESQGPWPAFLDRKRKKS